MRAASGSRWLILAPLPPACSLVLVVPALVGYGFPVSIASGAHGHAAISRSILVWEDGRYGVWAIYGRDLSTSVGFPVCTASGSQLVSPVSGNVVAWQGEGRSIPGHASRICDLHRAKRLGKWSGQAPLVHSARDSTAPPRLHAEDDPR